VLDLVYPNGTSVLKNVTVSAPTAENIFRGLAAGTQYVVRVRARNRAGDSGSINVTVYTGKELFFTHMLF